MTQSKNKILRNHTAPINFKFYDKLTLTLRRQTKVKTSIGVPTTIRVNTDEGSTCKDGPMTGKGDTWDSVTVYGRSYNQNYIHNSRTRGTIHAT